MPAQGLKVAYSFVGIDKFSAVAKKVARGAEDISKKFEKAARRARKTQESFQKLGDGMKSVGKKMMMVGAAIGALGIMAIKKSADMEQLNIAFEVLIGDVGKSKKVVKDLVDFTATTPFQLDEVMNAGKALLAFGVEGKEVEDRLRRLGELASASGKPLTEFALIFGKIKAKGKLSMEEVNQLAEKGVSLQTMLQEKYFKGVAGGGAKVADAISKGQITFEIFNELFEEMTDKGGQFYGLIAKQSKSTAGLWSTLIDNFNLFLMAIGDVLVDMGGIKNILVAVTAGIGRLTAWIQHMVLHHPKLVKIFLVFAAMPLVLGAVLFIIGGIITGFIAMKIAAFALSVATNLSMAPLILIPALIIAFIAGMVALVIYWDDLVTWMLKWISKWNFVANIIEAIGNLIGKEWNIKATYEARERAAKFEENQRLGTRAGDLVSAAPTPGAGLSANEFALQQMSGIGAPIDFGGPTGFNMMADANIGLDITMNTPGQSVAATKVTTSGDTAGLDVGVSMKDET